MADVILEAAQYFLNAALATVVQALVVLGPGLLLGFLFHLQGEFIQKRADSYLGFKLYYNLFGWLGTVIHEASHALFGVFFGLKIRDIKWYEPNPQSGKLGHVSFDYPTNYFQMVGLFFVGIGPLLVGAVLLYAISWLLLGPDVYSLLGMQAIPSAVFTSYDSFLALLGFTIQGGVELVQWFFQPANWTNWTFYLFVYFVFCIGSSISLSMPDIKIAAMGFRALFVIWLLVNVCTYWLGNVIHPYMVSTANFLGAFYAFMIFALIINALVSLVILIVPAFFSLFIARDSRVYH